MSEEVEKQEELLRSLGEPIKDDEVEWRVLRKGDKNGKAWAQLAPYVDSRAIQQRLDRVVGPGNWQNKLQVVNIPTLEGEKAKGAGIVGQFGMTAGIGIRINGEWVWKWDGADFSRGIEITKSAISDALKRAAVLWGIGRDLYELPQAWAFEPKEGRAPKGEDPRRVVSFKQGGKFYWALAPLLGALGGSVRSSQGSNVKREGKPSNQSQAEAGGAPTDTGVGLATAKQKEAIARIIAIKDVPQDVANKFYERLDSMPTFKEAGDIIQELSDWTP